MNQSQNRKKRSIFLGLLFLLCAGIQANAQSPVHWSFTAKKIAANKYELHAKAEIDQPWHIYSVITPSGGPSPTKLTIKTNPLMSLTGKISEIGKMITKYEPVFEKDVKFYENEVEFVQVITTKASVKTNLIGTVSYMACNDERCMPVQVEKFSVRLE